MSTARSLDAIVQDMVRLKDEHDRADDSVERARLRDVLNLLRAEAAEVRGPEAASLTDEELRVGVARYDRMLDDLRTARFDPSMSAGASGLGGGLDPYLTVRHNQAVDQAGGRDQVEAKRADLVDELARRGVDRDQPGDGREVGS